jgi:hypothetical protein
MGRDRGLRWRITPHRAQRPRDRQRGQDGQHDDGDGPLIQAHTPSIREAGDTARSPAQQGAGRLTRWRRTVLRLLPFPESTRGTSHVDASAVPRRRAGRHGDPGPLSRARHYRPDDGQALSAPPTGWVQPTTEAVDGAAHRRAGTRIKNEEKGIPRLRAGRESDDTHAPCRVAAFKRSSVAAFERSVTDSTNRQTVHAARSHQID